METYKGHVRAPADAIILFEACRLGLLPRVQRRLSEKERQAINSGSVFVWDEREAGMRRWTDGKSWSASRVSGSFLTYREMEGKRGGGGSGFTPAPAGAARPNGSRTPESGRGDSEFDVAGDEGPDGYRYKPDGLMKQSFSITTSSGNHLHLISYYARTHPTSQQLPTPSTDRSLSHIRPLKGMYPESTVHEPQNIPAVTRSPMAGAGYQTAPQMAGYARQQPAQWSPQQPNQAWPHPSPMHHRPPASPQYYNGYSPYGASAYYHGGPATPSNAPSPIQHPHALSSDSSHPTSEGPYDEQKPPSASQPLDPSLAAYDQQRQRPALPDDRSPPNPPPSHARNHSYDSRDSYQYDHRHHAQPPSGPHDPHPHPRQEYSRPPEPHHGPYRQSPPPHHEYYHHAQQQSSGYYQASAYPSYHQPPYPPPQYPVAYASPPTASDPQIDPRLTAASPQAPQPPTPGAHSHQPTPTFIQPEKSPISVRASGGHEASGRPPSQASTIPSIGALMNGSSPPPSKFAANSKEDRRSPPHDSKSHGNSNGHGGSNGQKQGGDGPPTNGTHPYPPSSQQTVMRSPPNGTASHKEIAGPQDIPGDKVGFSEDQRVLSVLDKGFR